MESGSPANKRNVRFEFLEGTISRLKSNGHSQPELLDEYKVDGGNIIYSYGGVLVPGGFYNSLCFGDLEDISRNQGSDYASTSNVTNRGGRLDGANFFDAYLDGSNSLRVKCATSRGAHLSSELFVKGRMAGDHQYQKVEVDESRMIFEGDVIRVLPMPEDLYLDGDSSYIKRELYFMLTENINLPRDNERLAS